MKEWHWTGVRATPPENYCLAGTCTCSAERHSAPPPLQKHTAACQGDPVKHNILQGPYLLLHPLKCCYTSLNGVIMTHDDCKDINPPACNWDACSQLSSEHRLPLSTWTGGFHQCQGLLVPWTRQWWTQSPKQSPVTHIMYSQLWVLNHIPIIRKCCYSQWSYIYFQN